ncbi:MAG: hypothetical protein OHK0023_15390 [Anaerolineae bacterium]
MSNLIPQDTPSMSDERHPINLLRKELTARRTLLDNIEIELEKFTAKLYAGFESAVAKATAAGIPNLGKPRRIAHPAGGWRQAMQVLIEDWFVLIVPLVGAARPNMKDEARVPNVRFKEPCGRVAFFLGEAPETEAFYDAIIFADGSWFAWGYGWPRMEDSIEKGDFEFLAFELLASFAKDIHTTWRPRRSKAPVIELGTQLKPALDAKQRAYTFGLPGDE